MSKLQLPTARSRLELGNNRHEAMGGATRSAAFQERNQKGQACLALLLMAFANSACPSGWQRPTLPIGAGRSMPLFLECFVDLCIRNASDHWQKPKQIQGLRVTFVAQGSIGGLSGGVRTNSIPCCLGEMIPSSIGKQAKCRSLNSGARIAKIRVRYSCGAPRQHLFVHHVEAATWKSY